MRCEDGRRNIGLLPIEKAKGRDAHNVFIKFHLCAQISVPINRKDSSAKNVQEKELARRKHHGAEAPRINTVTMRFIINPASPTGHQSQPKQHLA